MKQKGKAPIDRFVKLLREGLKLGYAFAGKNMSNFDDKTLKTLSPRFLSVTPEQDPEQNDTVRDVYSMTKILKSIVTIWWTDRLYVPVTFLAS